MTTNPRPPYMDDFRNFLWMVWMHLNLPVPTDAQYDIAEFLADGPKRSIVEAFRGVGKSWITSAYVIWVLLNDPQKRILVVSASKERSDAFTIFTKRLINEMPELAHLRSRQGQRDSSVAFDVGPADAAHAPSVKSVGITGQIAGSRADLIVADDIETPKNSLTQLMRDRLAEAIKEFDAVLTPKPDSRIIYLGTPQTEMSIYNLLPERGYEMRIWPARIPENVSKYEGRLSPYILKLINNGATAGQAVDPVRFDDFDLMEREASYGRSGFALQFMLDTSLSDANRYPLKLADLIIMDLDTEQAPSKVVWASSPDLIDEQLPVVGLSGDRYYRPMHTAKEWGKYTGSILAIDPSGRGADKTSYAIVKIFNGTLFVLECGGLDGGYDELTLNALAIKAKVHSVNAVIVESNFGDGMFTELFKPFLRKHHSCSVEEVRHSIQKEKRVIDTLEPIMNQHRLVMNRKVVLDDYSESEHPKHQLFYQMTRLTRERNSLNHDDLIDVLAIAVAYWVEHMARDQNEANRDYKASLLNNELEKFMENSLGGGRSSSSWLGL
jgi:Autographiviridae terminase large subunit